MPGSRARGRGIRRHGSGMAWWLWGDKGSVECKNMKTVHDREQGKG